MAINPYIQNQANQIQTNLTNNLQRTQLPGINAGAIAAGGFGGSRQGIAQGLAIGETNRGIADAQNNLYANAYGIDQANTLQRDLQQNQIGSAERLAAMQDATQRLGLGNQFALGIGNLGLGYTQANQNYDLGRGNLGVNQFQAQTARDLGMGNLGLGFQTANQNFALGQGNLANQQQQTANALELGRGNLGLGYTQANQNFALGQGSLANQVQQTQNQFNLGQQAANTNQYSAQTQRDLGFGNLGLGYTQAGNQYALGQQANQNTAQSNLNQYNLGLGNLALGNTQAQNTYNLGLGQLGLGQQQANQNFYTSQRGQDLQQLGLGANLIGQGNAGLVNQGQQLYNTGQTQQQAPWNVLQNYANLLQPFSGLGQSTQQNLPGGSSTLGNVLGGALTAAQLWKLLGG